MKSNQNKKAATRDYKVGYCKPPKNGQFKKGQSGNPSGRPRKLPPDERSADRDQVARDVLGIMERDVPLTINGKKVTISTAEFLILKLVEKAKNGDFRSNRLLLTLWEKLATERGERTAEFSAHLTKTTEKMVQAYKEENDPEKSDKIIEEYNRYMASDLIKAVERRIKERPPKKRY